MSDIYGPTVSDLIVNGTKNGVGSGLGGALGSVGGLLGGILSGWGSAPTTPGANVAAPGSNQAADNASILAKYGINDFYGSSPAAAGAAAGNTVSPLVVNGVAPAVAGGAGSALAAGLGLGAAGALTQALGGSSVPTTTADDVSPLDVVGSRQPAPSSIGTLAPAAIAGGLLSTVPTTTATPEPENDGATPIDLKTIAGAGALGLAGGALAGNGAGTLTTPPATTATPSTGLIPDALKPYLPLLATLVPGLVGGVTGGDTSGPTDALKSIADNNIGLSDRLGNIANAGMAGDIGGRGLNSIRHMVDRAQAAIRQRYAALGMSGSTAEGDDLNAAAQAGVDQQFKVGQQMAQTGLNAIAALTGQSASIYTSLLNAATAADTRNGAILTNFATAAGNALGKL